MKDGEEKVVAAIANSGKNINGWRVGGLGGDRADYHGDWLSAPPSRSRHLRK